MKVLQDIHTSDKSFWETLQNYWDIGNYAAVLALLKNNNQLFTKYIDADYLNELTNNVVILEEHPQQTKKTTFKTFYIPGELETGEVFFQISTDGVNIDMNMACMNVGQNTLSLTYPSTNGLLSFICFQDGEQIITDTNVDLNNYTITFNTEELAEKPIWCLVYSMEENLPTVANTVLTSGNLVATTSIAGNIIASIMFLDGTEMILGDFKIADTAYFELGESYANNLNCYVISHTISVLNNYVDILSGNIGANNTYIELNGQGYIASTLTFENPEAFAIQVLTDVILDYRAEEQAKVKFEVVESPNINILCTLIHT